MSFQTLEVLSCLHECMNNDDEHILCILSTGGILNNCIITVSCYKTLKYSIAINEDKFS